MTTYVHKKTNMPQENVGMFLKAITPPMQKPPRMRSDACPQTSGPYCEGPDVVIDIPSSGLRPDGEQMCAGVMNTTSLTLQVQHVTHRQQDNMMNPMVPSCVRTCHQTFCLPSTPWPLCHSCYVVSDVAHVPITPAWRLLGSHFQQRSLVLSTRALRDAQPWTETVLEVDA